MKRYPRQLEILGETYTIKFVKKFKDAQVRGLCDAGRKQISILSGMTRKETGCTLIHEVLHALSFEGGFKLKHKSIYHLESAIFSLLVDNFF